jgi:hypothetical protein
MKIKKANIVSLWESTKLLFTRNLWLKILSFILAIATYEALSNAKLTEY